MTKVTILDDVKQKKKDLKPIKAIGCLQVGVKLNSCNFVELSDYPLSGRKEIKIIKTPMFSPKFDCIIIDEYNVVFLGQFNDGIV